MLHISIGEPVIRLAFLFVWLCETARLLAGFTLCQSSGQKSVRKVINMSTTQYASASIAGLEIGKASRLTHEKTLKLSKDYAKADVDTRKQMRIDFMVSFIEGTLGIDTEKAKGVLATSRDDRTTAQQRAYAQGSEKFRYHIVRDTDEGKGGGNSDKSTDKVTLCIKYVNKQELTKAQLKKLIAALTA